MTEKNLSDLPWFPPSRGNDDIRGRTPAVFQGESGPGRSFPMSNTQMLISRIQYLHSHAEKSAGKHESWAMFFMKDETYKVDQSLKSFYSVYKIQPAVSNALV